MQYMHKKTNEKKHWSTKKLKIKSIEVYTIIKKSHVQRYFSFYNFKCYQFTNDLESFTSIQFNSPELNWMNFIHNFWVVLSRMIFKFNWIAKVVSIFWVELSWMIHKLNWMNWITSLDLQSHVLQQMPPCKQAVFS